MIDIDKLPLKMDMYDVFSVKLLKYELVTVVEMFVIIL